MGLDEDSDLSVLDADLEANQDEDFNLGFDPNSVFEIYLYTEHDLCDYNGDGEDYGDEADSQPDSFCDDDVGSIQRMTGSQGRRFISEPWDIRLAVRRGIELFIDGKHYGNGDQTLRVWIDDWSYSS